MFRHTTITAQNGNVYPIVGCSIHEDGESGENLWILRGQTVFNQWLELFRSTDKIQVIKNRNHVVNELRKQTGGTSMEDR